MLLRMLGLVIVVAALGLSAYYYNNSNSLTDQANEQYSSNQKNQAIATQLNTTSQDLSAEIGQLKARVAQTNLDISNKSVAVPVKVNTNDLVQELLNRGQESFVTIIPLAVGDWSTAKVGTTSYTKLDARIKVSGELGQVESYIKTLQNSVYPTLSIQSVNLAQDTETPGTFAADIALSLYATQ